MKNAMKVLGIIAIAAVIVFSVTGCGDGDNGNNNGGGGGGTSVELVTVLANGNSSSATTELSLYFDSEISGLTADDITLSGVSGVQKGTLIRELSNYYTLPISGFNAGGTLTVGVSKSGYTIVGSPKTVAIYAGTEGPAETRQVTVKITSWSTSTVDIVSVTLRDSATNTTVYDGPASIKPGETWERQVTLTKATDNYYRVSGMALDNGGTYNVLSGSTTGNVIVMDFGFGPGVP